MSSFYIHGCCVWDFTRQVRKWSPPHHYHRKYIWSSNARKSSKMEFQESQMGCLFDNAEDKMAIFFSTLLDIAADNIPKTSPFPKRKAKPGFDEDCQAAKKERNKANRLSNKHPSAANSMRARLIQARTKKLFKQKKRDSWNNYVSSVNVNTPSKKVWDIIRKITGKNVASPMHHLKDDNGTLITERVELANTLGAAIEKCSSSNIYSKEFQSLKAQKETQKINFKTNRNLRYNKFTMRDLKRSLKSPIIHLLGQIRSIMKFYATFPLRLSMYYWTS